MARSGPVTLSLPPFSGATRVLVWINIGLFFFFRLGLELQVYPIVVLFEHLVLSPAALLRGQVWQLLTYGFMPGDILYTIMSLLAIWLIGSYLEGMFGARWLLQLYLFSCVVGGLLGSAITFTHLLHLSPNMITIGAAVPGIAFFAAFAAMGGDQQIAFNFVIPMKVKYAIAIYLLIDIATLLFGADKFGALTRLGGAVAGYCFMKYAPRRGVALAMPFGFSERYFGLRNGYYRWKRRRAAKKFAVYMGKQGREVHFDKDGKYVDPDRVQDPNDKRWMN
jgi:membrane associated rhomboid family serine protease